MRVKRFTPALNLSGTYPTPAMTEHVAGRYVTYDDHEKIETELAALKARVHALETIGAAVIRDLRMRGERDSDGCVVVNLSHSIWMRLCDLIEGPEHG